MGVTYTVRTRFTPEFLLEKIEVAYREALAATEAEAKALAPGHLSAAVSVAPTGTHTANMKVDAPYAAAVESGAAPHTIAPRPGGILGNPRIGFVAGGEISHPGQTGQHFMARALESFKTLFVQAGRTLI